MTVYKGPAFSLRHLKDEVSTVSEGQECGLLFEDFVPKPNDKIKCTNVKLKKTKFMDLCEDHIKM